jgi:DNA-binding transcriptional MerR regulator
VIQEEKMTIGELSRRTGVSTQTIHYYLKEGLLPKPVKTSKTWAYYTYAHVERINMVRNLKERYFFPLKVIKGIIAEVSSHQSLMRNTPLSVVSDLKNSSLKDKKKTLLSKKELSQKAGVSQQFIDELEEMDFLLSDSDNHSTRYDSDDLVLVKSISRLLKAGKGTLEDLRFYQYFFSVLSDEINFVNTKIIRPGGLKAISLNEIESHLNTIRHYFGKRIHHYEERSIAKK